MPREFDIVENLNGDARAQYPLLLILQHDRVAALQSVIAAPLVVAEHVPGSSKLHPSFDIDGRRYVALVEELAAVPPSTFGPVVGPGEPQRYAVIAALDLLFTGF